MDSVKYTTKIGKIQYMPVMSEEEAWESQDNGSGFCLACGGEASGVEPDARKYECESCGLPKVYGIPELFLMGLVKLIVTKE